MAKKRTSNPELSVASLTIRLFIFWLPSSSLIVETTHWLRVPVIEKSRTIAVRLISMAMTGFFRTMVRPRASRPLSMLKYDPVVKKKVLFLEQKRGGKWSYPIDARR
jgi:large subunit ribosomal protein L33